MPSLQILIRLNGMCETMRSLTTICKNKSRFMAVAFVSLVMLYSGFQVMYTSVELDVCPSPSQGLPAARDVYLQNSEDDNITIVTMYLNLGSHHRTSFYLFSKKAYARDQYHSWLLSWGLLTNKVVAFFDDEEFIERFKKVRSHLPPSDTKIFKITRDELHAFRDRKKIEEVIANPSFTVTYPSDYTCTMNAKYDALEKAIQSGDITTKYIAWMDIGLFRKTHENDHSFTLKVPADFNSSQIGFSEVTPRWSLDSYTPYEIYSHNIVWVAGGFVLGTQKILSEFIIAYRSAVQDLLQQGLADTDQQVVASMYSPSMSWRQKVEVKTYSCPRGSFGLFGHAYLYFCLAYICKASAECTEKAQMKMETNNLLYMSVKQV